jgi:hypothetical protein
MPPTGEALIDARLLRAFQHLVDAQFAVEVKVAAT